MKVEAAGVYRRAQAERDDERLAWIRSDQAFFAAGACHVLAWTCRAAYPARQIGVSALRFAGERQVFHTFAMWEGWTFDHSGWHPEPELMDANRDFERHPLEQILIMTSLAGFCAEHFHRMPEDYWADPLPRARDYVQRFIPPWERAGGPA